VRLCGVRMCGTENERVMTHHKKRKKLPLKQQFDPGLPQ